MAFVNLCQDSNNFVSGISDVLNSDFKLSIRGSTGVFAIVENWTRGQAAPSSVITNCVNLGGPQNVSFIRTYGNLLPGLYRIENRELTSDTYSIWELQLGPTGGTTTTTTTTTTTDPNQIDYAYLCQDSNCFISGYADMAGTGDIEFKLSKKDNAGVYQLSENWTAGINVATGTGQTCVNLGTGFVANPKKVRPYGNIGNGNYRIEARRTNNLASAVTVSEIVISNCNISGTTTTTVNNGTTTTVNIGNASVNMCLDSNGFATGFTNINEPVEFQLLKKNNVGAFVLFDSWRVGTVPFTSSINCANLTGTQTANRIAPYGNIGNGDYQIYVRKQNEPSFLVSWGLSVNTVAGTTTTVNNGTTTTVNNGTTTTVPPVTTVVCSTLISSFNCTGNISEIRSFNLNVPTAGNYPLTIKANATEGTGSILVNANGQVNQSVNVPGGATFVDVGPLVFSLNAGNNTINIASAQNKYFCIDRICTNVVTAGQTTTTTTTLPQNTTTQDQAVPFVNLCTDSTCFITGFTNINEPVEFRLMKADGSGIFQLFRDYEDGVIPFSTQIACSNLSSVHTANRVVPYGNIGSGTYKIFVRKKSNLSSVIEWSVNINCITATVQPVGTTTTTVTGISPAMVNLCQDSTCFISAYTNIDENVDFRLFKRDNAAVYQLYQDWSPGVVPFARVVNNCVNLNGGQVANRVKSYGAIGSGDYRVEVRRVSNPAAIVSWALIINCNIQQITTTLPVQNTTTLPQNTTLPIGITTTSRPVANNDIVSGGQIGVAQLINIGVNDKRCTFGTTTFVVKSVNACIINMINSETGIATVTPTGVVWSFDYSIHCSGVEKSNTATVAGIANGQTTTTLPVINTTLNNTTFNNTTFNNTTWFHGNTTFQQSGQLNIRSVGNLLFNSSNNVKSVSSGYRNNGPTPLMIGTVMDIVVSGMPSTVLTCDVGTIQNGRLTLTRTVAPSGIFNIVCTFPHNHLVPINNAAICIKL